MNLHSLKKIYPYALITLMLLPRTNDPIVGEVNYRMIEVR